MNANVAGHQAAARCQVGYQMRQISVAATLLIALIGIAPSITRAADEAVVTQKNFRTNLGTGIYSYEIKEFTKNERVAVGPAVTGVGNRIWRWAANNKNDERFIFIPEGEGTGKFRIVSLRDDLNDALYFSIDKDGGAYTRKRDPDGKGQLYSLVWMEPDAEAGEEAYLALQENTKGEWFSIGAGVEGLASGFGLRWERTNGNMQGREKTQIFQIVNAREEFSDNPKRKLVAASADRCKLKTYVPPALISDFAKNPQNYPMNTRERDGSGRLLVDEDIVPALLIKDSHYTSALEQYRNCPYYRVSRYVYWDRDESCTPPRGKLLQFSPIVTEYTETRTSGMSRSNREEFQRIATWTVSFELKCGVVNASKGSTGYAETVTTTAAKEETTLAGQETTLKHSYQAPLGGAALVTWSLVEQTVISRPDGTEVASWEVIQDHNDLTWPEAFIDQPAVTDVSKKNQNGNR